MTTGESSEGRGPSRLLTLAIACVASVLAAIVTSEIWDGGVVGSAAVTPVIVAIVTDVLTPRARERQETSESPARRRRFPVGAVVAAILIGLVAFAIAAVALTVPEIVADKSITGDGGHTTYFGDNEDTPWGDVRSWSDCFEDIPKCVEDIIHRNQ